MLQSIDKQISSVEGKMEGAGYDADYTTEYLENMDVIPELQNIQVISWQYLICAIFHTSDLSKLSAYNTLIESRAEHLNQKFKCLKFSGVVEKRAD